MEEVLRALSSGDTRPAEEVLRGLNKRQKRTFANRLLAARVALCRMEVAQAHEVLDGLREREITDTVAYGAVMTRLRIAERMLGAKQSIQLLDSIIADETRTLLARQQKDFGALGTGDSIGYVARGAQVRWTVLPNTEGGSTFGLVTLLADGTWDEEHIQPIEILGLDPAGQVSYPFLMSDGRTLYFSYNGPGTLGGADIYVSRYDAENHTLLVPQQLPLPINTLANDYAYRIDEGSGIASYITEWQAPDGFARYVVCRSLPDGVPTALLDSVPVQPAGRAVASLLSVQPETESPTLVDDPEPLFFIADKPIHGVSDLTRSTARQTLERYLRIESSRQDLLQRLTQLRQSYRGGSSRAGSEEILALEEQEQLYYKELKALRNEVIRQEQNL